MIPGSRFVFLLIVGWCWHVQAQVELQDCLALSMQQKCFAAPCQFVEATCEKCFACGCSSMCYTAAAAASIQWPPHKCGDNLATNCDFLSSIKPGSTCAGIECKPEHVCKEYFCDSKCQARCVPRDAAGGDPGVVVPDPSPYQCPNGTPANKCWPTTDSTTCEGVKCAEGELCGTFPCSAAGTCTALCVKDPFYTKPPPSSICTNGAEPKKCTADPSCIGTTCPADSNCIERDCGDTEGCKAVCEPINIIAPMPPIDPNYYCLSDGAVASKCDFGDQVVKCDPACPEQAFCAPMTGCAGNKECRPVCVKDPWYVPPPQPEPSPYNCTSDTTAYWCYNAVDPDSSPCDSCEEGNVCSLFQCGPTGDCKYMCLPDPFYKPYTCGADFKQVAKKCDVQGDGKCDPRCSTDGTFCAAMKCDGGECKFQCVMSPWWEKMEPSPSGLTCTDGQEALSCNTGGDMDNAVCAKCGEGNLCLQAQCGSTGECGTLCLPDPYFRPIMCEDGTTRGYTCEAPFPNQGDVPPPTDKPLPTGFTKQGARLIPQGTANVATQPSPVARMPDVVWSDLCNGACTEPGHMCYPLSCSEECKYRCVKDPWYVPPPMTCLNSGFIAEPCTANGNSQDCSSLSCDPDMICGDFTCPDPITGDAVCSAQCVRQGLFWRWPPIWITEQQLPCADGSQGKLCTVEPNKDNEVISNCVAQNVTCESPMMCRDVECGGVCGPLCVPPPPPMVVPVPGQPAGDGSFGCPKGVKTADCTNQQSLCDKLGNNCPAGSVCQVSNCGTCKAVCQPLKTDDSGGEGSKGPNKSSKVCASGKAASAKTCTGKKNPCSKMKCSKGKSKASNMKCVVGTCGGCNAECVPKTACSNGKRRKGCKAAAANFCTLANCAEGTTCVPDQCNGCRATCVGPCKAGKYVSMETARCEQCPKGHRCPGGAVAPQPCNDGTFAAKTGQAACEPCPPGTTTPKPAKRGAVKGFQKCT